MYKNKTQNRSLMTTKSNMENENKTEFVRGFFFHRPKPGAPDFVRGNMGIKIDEAIEFLQEKRGAGEFINLDLLLAKDGQRLYFKVNTFQPTPKDDI